MFSYILPTVHAGPTRRITRSQKSESRGSVCVQGGVIGKSNKNKKKGDVSAEAGAGAGELALET
jgi:hypothetical protein